MRPMPPRRLRTLLVGLAMMVFGPPLGYAGWFGLLMHAAQPGQVNLSIAEAMARMQQLPGQLFTALIPLALGILCGAAGFFLVVATLAVQFLGQDIGPASIPGMRYQSTPAPQSPFSATADDSRYMPKYR